MAQRLGFTQADTAVRLAFSDAALRVSTRYDAANQAANTVTLTAKTGYHYQDRHTLWQLTPLLEQHFSAGRRFSSAYGLQTYLNQQLSPSGLWADWRHCDSTVISPV